MFVYSLFIRMVLINKNYNKYYLFDFYKNRGKLLQIVNDRGENWGVYKLSQVVGLYRK